jgi:crotonobetainyl-CoA:carnitine CoA-transferase CaiB-like acyl-CoA transferase
MKDDLPFSGLKVVDASQGVAGPHCGMLMALNGADVVKVEPPTGDWGRAIGRRYDDFSAYNIAFNRGKRSIALDLKSEDGLAVAARLMREADVVIENYRPGVLARFGLDYATLQTDNRDVIYVSITGFGQTGPKSTLPATDSVLQAFSGLMSVNLDGEGMPQRIGVLVIDVVTGLYAFQAVATALYRRAIRGGGRYISVSLMESIGAVQAGKMIEYHLEGSERKKAGVPTAIFRTADGYLMINARRDKHFKALVQLLGRPDFATDPRFVDVEARVQHEAELMALLNPLVERWVTSELAARLEAGDVLYAPVNDYSDYFEDAHIQTTEAVRWLDHPVVGEIPFHVIPGYELPDAGDILSRSPTVGEHTRDILSDLGYNEPQIQSMFETHAVTATGPLKAAD